MPDANPALTWDDVGHSGSLTDYPGSYTITAANQVLEGYRFTSTLVQAPTASNLIIRNCHFDLDGDAYGFNNDYTQSPSTDALIEDTTFEGASSSAVLFGGSGTKTLRRCRFRDNQSDHIKGFGSGTINVEDSFLGGLCRTEYGSIDYDALTNSFTVGEVITGQTSGSSATIVSITPSSGTEGTIVFRGASNGISSTVYFSDNETLSGNQGGSATANGAGTYEDIHADGHQDENTTSTVNYLRTTWHMYPTQAGRVQTVTPGSWLESDGIAAGGIEGDIYYQAVITYFSNNGAQTINITSCHHVGGGSNGIRVNNPSSEVNLKDNRFYPDLTYWDYSGNGTFNDLGGNVWAEAGTDVEGTFHEQFASIFTGLTIDPPSDYGATSNNRPLTTGGRILLRGGLPLIAG